MVRSYKAWFALLSAASAWGTFAGCSDANSNTAGNTPVASEDCQGLVAALCEYYARCAPSNLRVEFGNVEACKSRYVLACPSLSLPGVTWNAAAFGACTRALSAAGCYDDALESGACQGAAGTLPAGSSCESSGQCASNRCVRTSIDTDGAFVTPVCGTCEDLDGGSANECGSSPPCPATQNCVYSSMAGDYSCVTPRPEGGSCAGTGGCVAPLVCKGASSTADGVCARRSGAGGPCASSDECDSTLGLRCVQGVCATPSYVAPGASCETEGTLCDSGSSCRGATGERICIPDAADGAACDTTNGPGCREPASCRGGVCMLPGTLGCH